jgi:hypothetical protein
VSVDILLRKSGPVLSPKASETAKQRSSSAENEWDRFMTEGRVNDREREGEGEGERW